MKHVKQIHSPVPKNSVRITINSGESLTTIQTTSFREFELVGNVLSAFMLSRRTRIVKSKKQDSYLQQDNLVVKEE